MKLFSGIQDLSAIPPEEKRELLLAAVMFVFFGLAAIFTMINFMNLNNLPETSITGDVPIPAVTEKANSNVKIDELGAKYDAYVKSRTYSGQLVTLAEAVGRFPITDMTDTIDKVAAKSPEKYEVPEIVPVITIKALVIMEGTGIATLDIEGERPGQIVRNGYVFGGGKGEITNINAGGVSWKWANKKYHTDL